MITLIAPHARASAACLLASFRRQIFSGPRRLVVVENGEGLGSTPAAPDVTVIRSEVRHPAVARNAGLAWLRANGGGPWAMLDDDDYYGPGYLAEVAALLEVTGADVVGKPWAFVAFDDGLWRFSALHDCWTGGTLTGGTLAGRSADCEYPIKLDDDVAFCRAMVARGARLWSSSARWYCYNRRASAGLRAWPATQLEVRRSFGAAQYFGALPDHAVDWLELEPLRVVPQPTDGEILADLARRDPWAS